MVIDVAWTRPAASACPFARRHSPRRRSAEVAFEVLVTVATVGTVIVWAPEPVVRTVIEVPVEDCTSPLTKAIGATPD
jgi:hypothetical protein